MNSHDAVNSVTSRREESGWRESSLEERDKVRWSTDTEFMNEDSLVQ